MRVTFGTKYNQMNYHQNVLANKLSDVNSKVASGLKIQQGYQNPSVFNRDLKLDYDSTKLAQGIDKASMAQDYTLNVDKSLGEISVAMTEFKTKLLQAANDTQSKTSRRAIAQDLRAIKSRIINLANTSIGGKYLFAGSRTDKMPFDAQGNYYGNNEKLSVLIDSKNEIPYNITGQELFFGKDADRMRLITSNIRLLNQSALHPDIMKPPHSTALPKEEFIKPSDSIRDLVGDQDANPNNNGEEYFYLHGVGPDGVSFKSKFALSRNASTKVQDLLDQIGREYGNTSQNRVVEVTLNPYGQIEIQDLQRGNSSIQFQMISSDKNADSIAELYEDGAHLTYYNQSPFQTSHALSKIQASQDWYDKNQLSFHTTFITKDNQLASRNTPLNAIFSPDVKSLVLQPKNTDKNTDENAEKSSKVVKIDIQNNSIKDLIRQIQAAYQLEAEMVDGRLILHQKEGGENFSLELATLGEDGREVAGIPTDYRAEYDQVGFLNQGSSLIGNVAQNLANGAGAATESSKLEEVSAQDLSGSLFHLKIQDHNGVPLEASIQLGEHSYLILPHEGEPYKIPLYDAKTQTPQASSAKEVTYRQLLDAISIAMDYSNQSPNTLALAAGAVSAEGREAYQKLLQNASSRINATLDPQGHVKIQDTATSNTKMRLTFSNSQSDDFSEEGIRDAGRNLTLNANNALTISQSQISFFDQLDEIIDAVDRGISRPDESSDLSSGTRNIGIQNGIAVVDNLSDHIEKIIALNGARGKTFENIIHRNEVLKTQVESMKADNIGIDMAETYNKFNNLHNNYNAVLNSASKINQMSLVNSLYHITP